MNKQERDRQRRERLADDAALYLALVKPNGGCLIPMASALLLIVALGTGAVVAFAQADASGVPSGIVPVPAGLDDEAYPQAAYVVADPITDDRRTLATMDGRWTVEPDDQTCVPVNSQVWLTAPPDEARAALRTMDGTDCTLDPSVRYFRQAVPCAQRDGICDVDRELTPEQLDLP